jgi:hypothetical protein
VLLYNFLLNSNIALREDLDFLIAKSQKYIPSTVRKIRLILNATAKRRTKNIITQLFSLCDEVHKETGKHCVVILDEFQNLETMGVKELYKEWSKLLILQKTTMYIITSSMKFKTKLILSKNLSLLFGNFEVIMVDPFDIGISEEYLRHSLKGLDLNRHLRSFLVNFTGGYPIYLEIISDAILKSAVTPLSSILENLLFDASGVLNQRFSNHIKRFTDSACGKDYISILHLIASGNNKINDIAHILHKQRKDLNARINHLLELDTISRSADFLKINDRVFGFWLRFVYQEKMNSLTFDSKNQKIKFRDRIEGIIQEFLMNTQKPLTERMSELMRLFENELVQVERKRIRLSHFREVKPLEFHTARNLKDGLIGRSQDSLWIVALKDDLLTEDDISEFSRECKKYRHKAQRKVIVTLKEIDQNTRLRAMEEKIWAWDINSLNQMLDLFSQPRLIA